MSSLWYSFVQFHTKITKKKQKQKICSLWFAVYNNNFYICDREHIWEPLTISKYRIAVDFPVLLPNRNSTDYEKEI